LNAEKTNQTCGLFIFLGTGLTQMLLNQRGPTTFDLRAILQNCENSRTTSDKMMHRTTVSQDLKLKSENR